MKILFLAPHLSTGGMPSFLLKRIESLLEYTKGNELYVIEHSFYGDAYVVQRNAIRTILGDKFHSVGDDKMQIASIIETIAPDIIHIDEMSEALNRDLMHFIYDNNRTWRIVETCHNVSFRPNEEKIFHPDMYTFCTPYHEQTFKHVASNFVTINFPIEDNSDKVFDRNLLRGATDFDKKQVLNVGLWTPGKNQAEGIEIARKYPDMMFHFIGNQADNFKDYWEPLMKDLPDNVIVWGERDDIWKAMRVADIFMFNSTWECNPLVLREAISYGLPIIAHNLPQYVGMYDEYINPIDTDLRTLKCTYNVPTDNTSREFGLKHGEVYSNVMNLPITKQRVTIIEHFVDHPYLEIKGADVKPRRDNSSISIVLAHPNTPLRKQLLKNCISKLNTPVILSANHTIEEEAQAMCDYVLYTKDNPLLLKSEFKDYGVEYYLWNINDKGEKTYTSFEKEHGYSVYCLIKNGVEYAKKLGYDKVNVINYDYEISRTTIKEHVRELESNDFVVYKYNTDSYDESSYCSAFFSAKTDAALAFVNKFKDKRDYYTSGTALNILEVKLYNFINENNYKIKSSPMEELKKNNKVDVEGMYYTNENEKNRVISNKRFLVEYYDEDDKCVYSSRIDVNNWVRLNRQWFTRWSVKVWDEDVLIYHNTLNYEGKRVFIVLESKSLGDTLAWVPYALEFQKKHNCKVILSSFFNNILDYPELELVEPGAVVENLYGLYRIGWYYNEAREPNVPNTITMQKCASDILGLEYTEIKPRLKKANVEKTKQVCIAVHSTAQAKYWNNLTGWQEVVDWLLAEGYTVKLLSKEGTEYMGNHAPNGVEIHPNGSIESVIEELLKSEMFIGIGSGLSWLSWALDVPTVIISGFSYDWAEMKDCIRVTAPEGKCSGCFNRHRLDAGDWNWCPDKKDFECTKTITGQMVIDKIKNR
jgi:autotransporter strand-loop-strand O-heptosyltransferase